MSRLFFVCNAWAQLQAVSGRFVHFWHLSKPMILLLFEKKLRQFGDSVSSQKSSQNGINCDMKILQDKCSGHGINNEGLMGETV